MYSNGCIEISKCDGRVLDACAHSVAHACGIYRSIEATWRRPSATRLAASACRSYVNYAHGPRSCCRTRRNPSARCRVPLIAQATKPAAASKAGNEPAKNAKASNKTKQAEAAATGTAAEVCAHAAVLQRPSRHTRCASMHPICGCARDSPAWLLGFDVAGTAVCMPCVRPQTQSVVWSASIA